MTAERFHTRVDSTNGAPGRTGRRRGLRALALVLAAMVLPGVARAQLRPEQVLVVYDSRISDSLLVAEHYAGSSKVPGGTGGRAGTRPGVRVLNLAGTGAQVLVNPDIDRNQFRTHLRNPIRAWLGAHDPRGDVRCLVLTRGMPFRLVDASVSSFVGDNPGAAGTAFSNGTYSAASVDAELTLLWQNLDGADTSTSLNFHMGGITNPYWGGRSSAGQTSVTQGVPPINAFSTARRTLTNKAFGNPSTGVLPSGVYWNAVMAASPNYTAAPLATALTPGDLYLVSRLDAGSLASVRAMLDRSVNIVANVDTARFVIDESGSDGVANTVDNAEFDNSAFPGGVSSPGYGGDDWEQANNTLLNDGRFLAANVIYNALANNAHFVVGPLIAYQGQGLVVSGPVLLLAHYGANSTGDAPGENTNPVSVNVARSTYESSFNLAPGAVMNTMESYNGRAFGGYTPAFGQGSLADFIDAGGTFGLGNVWEPFSLTVPDNAQVVRNFYLGGLSWGEAAWSAVPLLSFQQIVIGDPLARVVRTSEDRNADQAITIEDLYAYETAPADLNRVGGVTDADRQLEINAVRASRDTDMKGAQRP